MADHSITRRTALSAAGIGVAALGATQAMAQKNQRKTFVLVHGAYHGGWCWRRVADLLEAHGHKVYAPSLTGNGDRSHLLRKDINLDTQIADIANLVTWEDLNDVCLVAHSFGGWPASGALEHVHDRVGSIVWLDAFKPEDGQKGTDFISEFSRKAMEEAVARGEPGRKPPPAKTFSISEKDYAWIDSKPDAAAERSGDAADKAHRQARCNRQEDLYPRAEISAGRLRQGAGRMHSRWGLADLHQRQYWP
jgi:pimeloyl-ACP methyl ester carboxylesterase